MLFSKLCAASLNVTKRNFRVTVCGAAGGIGQPLSLLLKLNPLIKELHLSDLVDVPGVGADLSHIRSVAKIKCFLGEDKIKKSVMNADIVLLAAGVPRKPGMTRNDLFKVNADIVILLTKEVAKWAPEAMVCLVTNPVNSLMPMVYEIMQKEGICPNNQLFGISSLDLERASTFLADLKCLDPRKIFVPVVGGHSATTMVPLFSQSQPKVPLTQKECEALTKQVREGGTTVVNEKAGKGSATLSMAHVTAQFTHCLLRAMHGECGILQYTYVYNEITEVPFLSTGTVLGKKGIVENLNLCQMSEYETKLFNEALPIVKKDIQTGIDYVKKKCC